MTHILRTLALPAALVATLAVASCGSGSSTPSATGGPSSAGAPSSTPPTAGTPTAGTPTAGGTQSPIGPPASGASNLGDVEFANTMTFYHLHEEAMVNLVPKHAKDAKVKALAPTIKKVQAPEIARMSGWLVGGGIPAPSVKNGEIIGHTMASMGGQTKAMTTKPEMAALGKATGSSFDRMWLKLMIRHHEGAVVTAKAELAKGLNTEAKQIAQAIIDRQPAQIATMKSILNGLAG